MCKVARLLKGKGMLMAKRRFADVCTQTSTAACSDVTPCFTPGTAIATPQGERFVETLTPGDRIITRDNGIQDIVWVGKREVSGTMIARNPHLCPVLIKAGSLGDGVPERDMMVSPNHRMLVSADLSHLQHDKPEALVAAKHLTGATGIHSLRTMKTTYLHFMFAQHEVVLANGCWTESFQPEKRTLEGMGNSQRTELFGLFPDLATPKGQSRFAPARDVLAGPELENASH